MSRCTLTVQVQSWQNGAITVQMWEMTIRRGKTVDVYLMDVLHTVGAIIVIVGIGWKALSNLHKGLKKEVLTQARMLENRMDQRASEMDRRIDDINQRLDKQDAMLATMLQNHLDFIAQFNTRKKS